MGALHLDVVLRAPHLPSRDETVTGSSVDYLFGGKGGNQAVAAARMGADVAFAGCVGSDQFGEILSDALAGAGVDTSQMQTDPGPSGMSAAIVDDQGDYGAVIVSGANLALDPERIELPQDVSLLLLQNEVPEAVNVAMARKAREVGIPVWWNAAPARTLRAEMLDLLDLIIVNRVESAYYGGLPGGVPVLRTLGAEGVEFAGSSYPGFDVEVISTHGAGDMFVGALAARLDGGHGVDDAISFAQAAAALHVSTPLSGRGLIRPSRVEGFRTAQDVSGPG